MRKQASDKQGDIRVKFDFRINSFNFPLIFHKNKKGLPLSSRSFYVKKQTVAHLQIGWIFFYCVHMLVMMSLSGK